MTGSAHDVVRSHELSVPADRRRRLGVHYTPPHLARRLVRHALDQMDRTPGRVVDPCCGAGAFLLAVADELVARGVDPAAVPGRLHGADIDAGAVAAARESIERWSAQHGVSSTAPGPDLSVADSLLDPPSGWTSLFDLVVGNPPFLGQLANVTARRREDRDAVAARFPGFGPYTDGSGLFLVAATRLLADGGAAVMVQPQSVLSARDAAPVRDAVLSSARLVGLWADDRDHFDASVRVCAVVLRAGAPAGVGAGGAAGEGTTALWWRDEPALASRAPAPGRSWGPVLAPALGVPAVDLPADGPTLSRLATATAGFRDEFYAVATATRDPGEDGWSPDLPRLATVGLVDPARLWWGERAARVAGQRRSEPRVDLTALGAADARVARWVTNRLRPKVLVATQTRVLEAAVDPDGDVVPLTPLISVEPLEPGDLWLVGAALLAPPVAAAAAAELLGTGRATGSVRWSARRVLEVPLPPGTRAWSLAAARLAQAHARPERRIELLREVGMAMCEAHGLDPWHPVAAWWSSLVLPSAADGA